MTYTLGNLAVISGKQGDDINARHYHQQQAHTSMTSNSAGDPSTWLSRYSEPWCELRYHKDLHLAEDIRTGEGETRGQPAESLDGSQEMRGSGL